ncbi:MAG: hypothetical protein IPP39_15560 [Chitinophagaceae bacterium]|nr:hypothetical protein [Chitinophagaceae bacterium]
MDLKEQIIKEYLEQGWGTESRKQSMVSVAPPSANGCKSIRVFMAWIEQPNNKATILETWMTPTKKVPKKQITADDLQKKLMPLKSNCNGKLRADALDTLSMWPKTNSISPSEKVWKPTVREIKRHIVLLVYKLSAGCWAI